jgi:L-amino acid N-acyltransferase YncA
MEIRAANLDDAPQIARIYAPFVEHSHISFEERAPSTDEMRERIRSYTQTHPWLVATENAIILGYAYACEHRTRPAYRWSADSAIYMREDARGRGIGKALYLELFHLLKLQRFHSVYAGITLPNDASIALHRSVGFTPVGIYREVGYKNGVWRNTSWWQLQLSDPNAPPDEPLLPKDIRT